MTATNQTPPGYKSLDALRHAIDKRLNAGSMKFPMMPQVAGQVMALTLNPNTDLGDLSALIHKDPALAARVVQVANSAAYAPSQAINSLEEAVNRLGITTLSEITLSASLHSGVFRAPGFEEDVNRLWKHSLASAYYGKELGRIKRSSGEGLFLCGLLHAIGKPVVLQLVAQVKQQHDILLKPVTIETVLEEFGCKVSTRLAEEWKLPQPIQIACSHYKRYSEAPACQEEAATTYLADSLAAWLTQPGSVDESSLAQDPVLGTLQFAAADLQAALDRKEEVQVRVSALT